MRRESDFGLRARIGVLTWYENLIMRMILNICLLVKWQDPALCAACRGLVIWWQVAYDPLAPKRRNHSTRNAQPAPGESK
jgi:hypothetical protein